MITWIVFWALIVPALLFSWWQMKYPWNACRASTDITSVQNSRFISVSEFVFVTDNSYATYPWDPDQGFLLFSAIMHFELCTCTNYWPMSSSNLPPRYFSSAVLVCRLPWGSYCSIYHVCLWLCDILLSSPAVIQILTSAPEKTVAMNMPCVPTSLGLTHAPVKLDIQAMGHCARVRHTFRYHVFCFLSLSLFYPRPRSLPFLSLSLSLSTAWFCQNSSNRVSISLWCLFLSLAPDVDECRVRSTCHSLATCSNTIGSYSCSCLEGFTGSGIICAGENTHKRTSEVCWMPWFLPFIEFKAVVKYASAFEPSFFSPAIPRRFETLAPTPKCPSLIQSISIYAVKYLGKQVVTLR